MYHQFSSPFSRAQTPLLQAMQCCSASHSHPQRHCRQQNSLPHQISMPSFPSIRNQEEVSGAWEILAAEPPCNASSICFWREGSGLPAQRGYVFLTFGVGNYFGVTEKCGTSNQRPGKECVTCFLGMFHPNTIFIGKKSNWFWNIEENVSILHNGTVILNSHLELCALMDKRNRHPSTLKKFSCKSFWRVMLPSHYLTALHPDLPPPTFSSGINTTLLSFISSQNTLPSWRPPPSVPAAHASPTSTGTCTDMYTPVPTTAPYLCSREKRNPRHKISPLLSQHGIANKIFANTQTHKLSTLSSPPKGSYFTAFLHGTMSTRKPCNSQSSAQENSHLHSVTKSPKANTVPSDMQLVFRNKGRRGGKGTSHCQHWKFVRCFQNCISRWAKRPSATCMQLTGTPDLFPNVIPNSPCSLLCKISSVNPSFVWVRAKNHSVQGSLCPNKYQAIFTYASKLQFGKKKLIHPRALWSSDKSFPD